MPDIFLKSVSKDKEKRTILKLLFYYFESNIHDLLITEKEDLDIYYCKELVMYREYVTKKAVKDSMKSVKNKYIVQLFPNEESIENVINYIKRNNINAKIRNILDGQRVLINYKNRIYDIISYDLIQSFVGRLKIIVENIKSDKLFIETILKHLGGFDPDKLFIEFVHGGGSTIVQVAETYEGKSRVFCLIDGDEISPGEYSSDNTEVFKKSVVDICEKYGYGYHVLSKRAIENYIPDEALERVGIPEHHPYFQLPDIYKDYFDMKKGIDVKTLNYGIWKKLNQDYSLEIAATGGKTKKFRIGGFGEKFIVHLNVFHVGKSWKNETEKASLKVLLVR
jgi:hypothetical protein